MTKTNIFISFHKNLLKSTLLLLLIGLAACGGNSAESGSGKVSIKGIIQQAPKGTIVLEKLEEQAYQPIETIALKNNETFSFEVNVTEPDFYRLNLFNEKQYIYLVLQAGQKVEITVDASQADMPFKVNGSKDTDYFRTLNERLAAFKQEQEQLIALYQATEDETERASIQQRYERYQQAEVTRMKAIIDTIIPSVSVMFALNFFEIETELEYIEQVADRFAKELPNSRHTKSLVGNLAQYKQSLAGQVNPGQAAPDIALLNPQGETVRLSSLKGKLVLVDFWASWCRPCREENPNVVKLYQKHKDQGFEILGVSLDQDRKKWLQAIEADGLTWVHGWDEQGEVAQEYQVNAIPATFLVDAEGKVIATGLRGQALAERVATELQKKNN
jgi:peroxiredoxin